jgi:hypothetical protein
MNVGFLRLQISGQLLRAFDDKFVIDRPGDTAIPFNCIVDLDASLAHYAHRVGQAGALPNSLSSIKAEDRSMILPTIIVMSVSRQCLFFAGNSALKQTNKPRAAPELNIVSINQALGVDNGIVVVGAN